MATGGLARWAVYVIGGLAALTLTGCGGVSRRFVVESNVPGAQVYINDRPVGVAPAHSTFEYYGYYNISVVHPDFQTETRRVHIVPPWYAYPPIDFLAEVVLPFNINDTRPLYFELGPARQTNTGELLNSADALRERGWNLPPPPPQPAYARKQPPLLGPPVTPSPTPDPALAPVPPANPLPAPAPLSVIPSVTPAGFIPPSPETFLR